MSKEVIELSSENFDVMISKGKWVVDYWAEWCIPCRIMAPVFEETAKQYKGKINFAKVDVDKYMELANRFQIMSIPTTIFFKNKEQVNRFSGALPKEELIEQIEASF